MDVTLTIAMTGMSARGSLLCTWTSWHLDRTGANFIFTFYNFLHYGLFSPGEHQNTRLEIRVCLFLLVTLLVTTTTGIYLIWGQNCNCNSEPTSVTLDIKNVVIAIMGFSIFALLCWGLPLQWKDTHRRNKSRQSSYNNYHKDSSSGSGSGYRSSSSGSGYSSSSSSWKTSPDFPHLDAPVWSNSPSVLLCSSIHTGTNWS